MKKECKVIVGAIVIILLTALSLLADSEWKEVKNRKGIKLDARKLDNSPIKEFRSQCLIDAPIEVAYEILKDPSAYINWLANCSEMRLVHIVDEDNLKFYQVMNLPAPFRDRDTVNTYQYDTDWNDGKVLILISGGKVPKDAPYNMYETTKKYRRLRLPTVNSSIVLDRITPGKTKMTYQVHVVAGVAMPAWLINILGVSHPYNSLLGFRKEVKKEMYYKRAEKTHNRNFVMSTQKWD